MEILNYIRNLFHWNTKTDLQGESKKRRSEFSDGYPYLNKHRRVGTFAMTSPKDRMVRVNHKRMSTNCMNRVQRNDSLTAKKFYSIGAKDNSLNISDDDDEVILLSSNKKPLNSISLKESVKKNSHARQPTLSSSQEDDDDILFVTCIESDEVKAKRQGYTFFKSHIDSPFEYTRPRLSSIRHVRTPITMQRKRYLTPSSNMNDSIRPDEKRKYQEMLCKLAPNFGNFIASSCNGNSLTDTPLNVPKVDSRTRSRKLVDLAVGSKSPVIDLTEDNFRSSCSKSKSSTPCQPSPVTIKDSSDSSDIECLGTTVLPKEKRPILKVNSLKSSLDLKPVCSSEWVQQLKEKHEQTIREKLKEIENYKMRADLYRGTNKKLYEEALEDRIRKSMQITEAVLVEDSEDEIVEIFPPLTEEQENLITKALNPNPSSEVLIEKFNIRITRHDIHTLSGLNWLNDEVINFYMNLLMERGKQDNMSKVYSFNTFFYPKLVSGGHSVLRRWTKRVDIFEYDLIMVPIHLGMHWCMSIIDFRDKSIRYYDSMGGNNRRCVEALLQYLTDERMDKKKEKFDTSGWSLAVAKDIPQQMNGSDCGMFSCTFAEFVSRNAKFDFSQEDMPYLRRKMVYEIITGKLMMT